MNDTELRQRIADLLAEQPAMRGGVADDLRRGRRSLWARRGAAMSGASVAAVAVAAVLSQVTGSPSATNAPAAPPEAEPDPGRILERCFEVGGDALDPDRFGPATRVLVSDTSPTSDTRAVLVSPDERFWADCWLRHQDPAGPGTVATYPMAGERPGPLYGHGDMEVAGPLGAAEEEAGSLSYSYLDRFPADVARVELAFPSGTTMTAEAVDGFVVFERDIAPVDDDDNGGPSITLYGASGEVVADESMAPGDASLPVAYRTMVPLQPLSRAGDPDPH